MKTGIVSTAYISRYGLTAGSERMRAHGYDSIDYQGFINTKTDFFKLSENDFAERLRAERKVFEKNCLTVGQVHGPWRSPKDFSEADRMERFGAMSKAVRGAAYLGSPYLVIHPLMPFGANSTESPDVLRELNLSFFSLLAEVGRENHVCVCLENMPFRHFPLASCEKILELVNEIGSEWLKVCLDTGHCTCRGESAAEAVRLLGSQLAVLHVHDNDGTDDMHSLPGSGITDWNAFAEALREISFGGVVSLETQIKGDYSPEEFELRERRLAEWAGKIAGK